MSDTNDMVIDTDSFNFLDLDDVSETDTNGYAKPTKKAPEPKADEGFDVEDFNFDSLEDNQPAPEFDEDDASDLEVKDENIVDTTHLDDSAVINIDGVELTKGQLKELANDKSRIDADKEFLDVAANTIHQGNEWIQKQFLKHQLSIDTNIQILERRLQDPSRLSATEYREYSEDLKQARNALTEINNIADKAMSDRKKQEDLLTAQRIRTADYELQNEYQNWPHMKRVILEDMFKRGVSPERLEKVYDKALMQTALESYMFRQNKQKIAEKAKATAGTIRTARSTSNAAPTSKAKSSADKSDLIKKMYNPNNNRYDELAIFNALED